MENRGYESEVTRLLSALNQREGREEGRSDWRQSCGSRGTKVSLGNQGLLEGLRLLTCPDPQATDTHPRTGKATKSLSDLGEKLPRGREGVGRSLGFL